MTSETSKLVVRGANLPKFLLLSFCGLGGVLCAVIAGRLFARYNLMPLWLTTALGFILGSLLFCMLFFLLVEYRIKWFLSLPYCKQDRCYRFAVDYTWMNGTIFGWIEWSQHYFRCKCGDRYLRIGKRFMRVQDDGTLIPYKRLERQNCWIEE